VVGSTVDNKTQLRGAHHLRLIRTGVTRRVRHPSRRRPR